jgi:CRP/FNR family transcriptional regulator
VGFTLPHLLPRINELAVRELNQAHHHRLLFGRRSAEDKISAFLIGWCDRLVQLNSPPKAVPLPVACACWIRRVEAMAPA